MDHGPWRITFDTNPDDCNLQCIMCEDHSPYSKSQENRRALGRPKRRMDIATIRRVLEELKDHPPRELIPSTMGEPLLYPHFPEILELCRTYGIRLNLTTNGTFPGGGAEYWARQIVPLGSDVKISINGATAATQEAIMLKSRFDHVLGNIRAFVAVRDQHHAAGGHYCSVTLQATFMSNNVGELPDLVRLAAQLNVDRVKGHHLWDHFVEIKPLSMRRSPAAIARWNHVVEACRQAARDTLRPNGKEVRLENIFPLGESAGMEIAPDAVCPFLGQEAWINAHGRFDPCCAPDEQRKSLGSFGTVQEQGFLAIWKGAAYQQLRTHYLEQPLCRQCPMRRPVPAAPRSQP